MFRVKKLKIILEQSDPLFLFIFSSFTIQIFTVHEQTRPIDILYMKDDDLYEMRKNQRVVSPILVYYMLQYTSICFQMFSTDFPERLALLNSSLCSGQIKIYLFSLGRSRTPNFSEY